MLVHAAAAGDAKLAKAAAKAVAEGTASASITAAVAGMPVPHVSALRYADIYALTDMELCGFAAAVATLLLAMEQPYVVLGSQAAATSTQAADAIAAALSQARAQGANNMAAAGFQWKKPPVLAGGPAAAGAAAGTIKCRADEKVVKSRAQLVESHASIPTFLQGILCLSPADSMHSMQASLARVLMVLAFGAVVISTLVCRDGVMLASLAGLWQAVLVGVMFVLLHCVPQAPSPAQAGGQDRQQVCADRKTAWKLVRDDMKISEVFDPQLQQILNAA
jgi:hypothetical protein